MMGYDVSWAGFNIIEVMSSTKFTYKRIGYLAASQIFHPDIEVFFYSTPYFVHIEISNTFNFLHKLNQESDCVF